MTGARDLSLVFPMAAGREGPSFRPLDKVAGEAIIHRALRGFDAQRDRIERVYFVYTEAEEARFDVARQLETIADGVPFAPVLLAEPTAGPAETVAQGVQRANVTGRAIVCDIDHRVDITPLLASADSLAGDAHVATWPLHGEDLKRWSVGCVDNGGLIREVAERRLPTGSGSFAGIIGCYHFPAIERVAERCLAGGHTRYASYFNVEAEAGAAIRAVQLNHAEFFGDAQRIRAIEESEKRFKGTIFCDIDGTLLEHEDVPSYTRLPILLDGSRDKLNQWVDDGYFVVLCTARSAHEEDVLRGALDKLGLRYHRLICGLPSGPRILINDRKPSAIFTQQAHSFEIARNQGIERVHLPDTDHPTVLRRFEGGSFAETLLLDQHGKTFVRKRASKHDNLAAGYARLRAQFRTVERFDDICPGIVPKLIGERDDSHEYYYDMEYLEGYRQLNELAPDEISPALDILFDRFQHSIYSHQNRAPGAGDGWFETHIEQKIYAKMDDLARVEVLSPLLFGDGAEIDGRHTPSLERLMFDATTRDVRALLAPQFLSIVHGDFTFQNIMVGQSPDAVRVIDMESGSALDAIELDLGKLLQSVLSHYDSWHLASDPLTRSPSPGCVRLLYDVPLPDAGLVRQIEQSWGRLLMCSPEQVRIKGYFYLGLHLVRMVPFRLRESEDQALYALATALQWVDRSLALARGE